MRLASAEAWQLPPGQLHLLAPAGGSSAPPVVPLSLNQHNHLAAVAAGGAPVWLAVCWELPYPLGTSELDHLAAALTARHSALQMAAVTAEDGTTTGVRHAPGDLRWRTTSHGALPADEVRARLLDHLRDACHPGTGLPALALAVVVHPSGSTVVAAFDHSHVDAISLPILLEDAVSALWDEGTDPGPAGCFASRAAEWSSAPRIAPDDERLRAWHDLFDVTGNRPPTFPLDLGVPPGVRAPHATTVADLTDATTTERLGAVARAGGASTSTAVLAAFAVAVRRLGGPEALPLVMPVQTRGAGDERAVGWFTTTVPVLVPAHDAGDAAAHARGAAEAISRALTAAELPLDQVLSSLNRPLSNGRSDVSMVSWVDYRRVPGHRAALDHAAFQVSAPTECDDLQVWLARTDRGVQVRLRHPATDVAHDTVRALVEQWRGLLEDWSA